MRKNNNNQPPKINMPKRHMLGWQILFPFTCECRKIVQGLHWLSSGQDSEFPQQGAWVCAGHAAKNKKKTTTPKNQNQKDCPVEEDLYAGQSTRRYQTEKIHKPTWGPFEV